MKIYTFSFSKWFRILIIAYFSITMIETNFKFGAWQNVYFKLLQSHNRISFCIYFMTLNPRLIVIVRARAYKAKMIFAVVFTRLYMCSEFPVYITRLKCCAMSIAFRYFCFKSVSFTPFRNFSLHFLWNWQWTAIFVKV